jgi:hypothetical protein
MGKVNNMTVDLRKLKVEMKEILNKELNEWATLDWDGDIILRETVFEDVINHSVEKTINYLKTTGE